MSSDHHTSPIKTPRQLITVVILAFVVPVSDIPGGGTAAATLRY